MFKMIRKCSYKNKLTKGNTLKPFERMTDSELITLYYKINNIQDRKNMNVLLKLNEYLLKSGKIELIR